MQILRTKAAFSCIIEYNYASTITINHHPHKNVTCSFDLQIVGKCIDGQQQTQIIFV